MAERSGGRKAGFAGIDLATVFRGKPREIEDVGHTIAEMRKVKSPAEIALLQKAIDITGEAQRDAAAQMRPGAFEYEVQAAVEAAFTRNGSERPGWLPPESPWSTAATKASSTASRSGSASTRTPARPWSTRRASSAPVSPSTGRE